MGGDRELVFVSCRNDLATLTAYAAALLGDHVVALIDGQISPDVLQDLVQHTAVDRRRQRRAARPVA